MANRKKSTFFAGIALALLAGVLAGCNNSNTTTNRPDTIGVASGKRGVKIGFIVSDLNLPWYAVQKKWAEEKCKELGCEIYPFQARDETSMEAALTDLASKEARGVIIASSNPTLGERIISLCEKYRMRLMTLDSRLTTVIGTGETKFLDVPFTGPDYRQIGNEMGKAILDEMKVRGWNASEVGVVAVRLDSTLEGTLRCRGAQEILDEAGINKARVFSAQWPAPQSFENARSTASTLFGRGAGITKWVAYGYNDTAVQGIVRAAEARGISADNLIAVGATGFGITVEFSKPEKTAFFASIAVSPKKQAEDAVSAVYEWSSKGLEPDTMPIFQPPLELNRSNFKEKLKADGML